MILQDRYHPGIFSGKWSCCDHRSKHSQGCRESFILQQQQQPIGSPPATSYNGASAMGRGGPRGPLPPTPMQNLAPSPPPHGSQYLQNSHGPIPNAPRGYESHDLQVPSGRSSYNSSELPPPPVPVSICTLTSGFMYVYFELCHFHVPLFCLYAHTHTHRQGHELQNLNQVILMS